MNPKENKVLSEYFKKIEKAEQAVLQSNDTEAILYFIENALISDKGIDYLFHFANKKYKTLFLDRRSNFTPAQQISICKFGTTEMINQLINKLHFRETIMSNVENLIPAAERILLGPTKQAVLYDYLITSGISLNPENLLQFFQTSKNEVIEEYFKRHEVIPINAARFEELNQRGLGDLLIEYWHNCKLDKETYMAVFESDLEKLKTKIIQDPAETRKFDADFVKKYGYEGLMKYPFSGLTKEAQKILYEQDKDQFWNYCIKYKIHMLGEYQEELRTDKNREKLWLDLLKTGFIEDDVLKKVIQQEPQQLPLYIEHNTNQHWTAACMIISCAPAPLAKIMGKKAKHHPSCREVYEKRFNWFQRTFG